VSWFLSCLKLGSEQVCILVFFFLLVAVFYGWKEQRNQTNVHILRSWTFWTSITFSTWTAVISVGKLIWPQKRCRIIRAAPSNGSIGNFNSSLAQIGRRCPRVDFRSKGTRGAASGTVQFLALYPTYSHYCCNNIKHSCFVFFFFFKWLLEHLLNLFFNLRAVQKVTAQDLFAAVLDVYHCLGRDRAAGCPGEKPWHLRFWRTNERVGRKQWEANVYWSTAGSRSGLCSITDNEGLLVLIESSRMKRNR